MASGGSGATVTFGKMVLPNGVITSASDDNPTGSSLSMEIGPTGELDNYNPSAAAEPTLGRTLALAQPQSGYMNRMKSK